MKKVYFEIFGTKLVAKIDDKAKSLYSDGQIEYYVRGQIKIHKIEEVEEKKEYDLPDALKDIFGVFK